LRIQEPAADLAAAAALVSSLANAPLPPDAVYFGEVSLSGAVRPVAQTAARLKEAAKLGFARAILPQGAGDAAADPSLTLDAVGSLSALVAGIAERGGRRNASPRGSEPGGVRPTSVGATDPRPPYSPPVRGGMRERR
jgi:DNA repair protein RadA/Sms